MNERIRQLAIEAGFYANPDVEKFEKFAELIVRKCADIGQRYADGNYEVYNQILEYFGMEEE